MSLSALMTQRVTLNRTTGLQRDAIGGTTPVITSTSVLAYLEPRSGTEDLADRNTGIGDWLMILPAGVDVIGWDSVDYGTRHFEIVAPPRPEYNPTTQSLSHWELDLQEVEAPALALPSVEVPSGFDSGFGA